MSGDYSPELGSLAADRTSGQRSERVSVRGRSRRPLPSPRRVGVEIGVASVVFGLLMGWAWYVLGPEITGEAADNGVLVPIAEARQLFDRVAIFSLLGAGIGLVHGLMFSFRHRRRPVTVLLALAASGTAGSLLALGVGMVLGPSAGSEEPGTVVELPMELAAPASLFAWPLVAIVVVTVVNLLRDDQSPWIWNGRRGE